MRPDNVLATPIKSERGSDAGLCNPAIAIARLHKGAKAPSLVVEATRSRLVKQSFLSPFNWLCAFGCEHADTCLVIFSCFSGN